MSTMTVEGVPNVYVIRERRNAERERLRKHMADHSARHLSDDPDDLRQLEMLDALDYLDAERAKYRNASPTAPSEADAEQVLVDVSAPPWERLRKALHSSAWLTCGLTLVYTAYAVSYILINLFVIVVRGQSLDQAFSPASPYLAMFALAAAMVAISVILFGACYVLLHLNYRVGKAQVRMGAEEVMHRHWDKIISLISRLMYWDKIRKALDSVDGEPGAEVLAVAAAADSAGACFGCPHLRTTGQYVPEIMETPEWECAAHEATEGLKPFTTVQGTLLAFPNKAQMRKCAYPGKIVRRWDICD